MCKTCDQLRVLFKNAKSDQHGNYTSTIDQLTTLKQNSKIEIIMADCDFEEAIEVLYSEMHYTVLHYFHCTECQAIHRIGACIRGAPLYENNIKIDFAEESKKLWGNVGTYFREIT